MNMKICEFLLVVLIMFTSQASANLPATLLNYNYGADDYSVVDRNTEVDTQNYQYDNTRNPRYCSSGFLSNDLQKKTRLN